jgi:transposase
MTLPLPKPKALLPDKGYDGDRFRESLLLRGILPVIPPRSNRKVPEHPDYRRYKDRNRVERMFGKLKQQRRIATRYDKPSSPSKAYSTLPPLAYGSSLLSTRPSHLLIPM